MDAQAQLLIGIAGFVRVFDKHPFALGKVALGQYLIIQIVDFYNPVSAPCVSDC